MRSDKLNTNSGSYADWDDLKEVAGVKKWASFAGSLADTNAAAVAYGDNDILVYLGVLDITVPDGFAAPNKILVEKIVLSVTTAAGETLAGKFEVGSAGNEATNTAATGRVEIYGAGATQLSPEGYALATTATEADVDFNSATVQWTAPNILLATTTPHLYACATTTVNADITAGRFQVLVEYTVL